MPHFPSTKKKQLQFTLIRMEILRLTILAAICVGVNANSFKDPFTCHAGDFVVGQRGSVTCHVGPDIHSSLYHFEVVRYPFDAPASHSGEEVLRCHRLQDKFQCTTEKGFEFHDDIQHNLTVMIPTVTKEAEGRYACQLIPPEGRKKRLCELRVKETAEDAKLIVSRTSADLSGAKLDSCSQTGQILAVILATLLIPSVILNICTLGCHKKNKKRSKRTYFAASGNGSFRGLMYQDKNSDDSDEDSDANVRGITCIIPRILPYNKLEEEEKGDQSGPPPSRWHERFPYRQRYNYSPQPQETD
ncbi:uncharacterized protein [Littorina saxatilis]|uniref:uncharacterized protein n=1 Tax=Littorina saxatilis TaxID=31220 RepID=UPI0038B566E5